MIKKIYSAPLDEGEENSSQIEGTDKVEKLKKAIGNRRVFSYTYLKAFRQRYFDSALCCCCRYRRKRDDWLYKDALEKLSNEIDILDIVKKLRVHQFAAETVLKPN